MVVDFSAKQLFGYDPGKANEKIGEKFIYLSKVFLSFPLNNPGTACHKCLKKVVTDSITATLKERLASSKNYLGDLLDRLLRDLHAEKFLSEDFIVNIVFGLLLASSESISVTVTLVLKFLAENPQALEELLVEHEGVMKNRENPGSPLTWNEVKSMNFSLHLHIIICFLNSISECARYVCVGAHEKQKQVEKRRGICAVKYIYWLIDEYCTNDRSSMKALGLEMHPLAYVAPPSSVVGRGELVIDRGKIASSLPPVRVKVRWKPAGAATPVCQMSCLNGQLGQLWGADPWCPRKLLTEIQYGPVFRTHLAGRPVIVSVDPDFNRYIFQQEGKLVEIWYMDSISKLFAHDGEARTNQAGYVHKYIRNVTLNHFGLESLREKLLPLMEDSIDRTLSAWCAEESIEVKKEVLSVQL
ncbi:hypothetical protein Ancab_028182 [Ancistrocladus abbreviatus]